MGLFVSFITMMHASIYINKKEECLFVRYAFGSCNSYDHQIFHDGYLGLEEGWNGHREMKSGHG